MKKKNVIFILSAVICMSLLYSEEKLSPSEILEKIDKNWKLLPCKML